MIIASMCLFYMPGSLITSLYLSSDSILKIAYELRAFIISHDLQSDDSSLSHLSKIIYCLRQIDHEFEYKHLWKLKKTYIQIYLIIQSRELKANL